MTLHLPSILVKQLFHRNEQCIALQFPYHETLIEKIKSLPGSKFSKTHHCWYIDYNKECWQAFLALQLAYTVEKPLENSIHCGTVEPDRAQILHTAIEKQVSSVSRHSEPSELRSISDSDILRTQVGKLTVQFSKKVFIVNIPYEKRYIQQVKSLKKSWWNSDLKQWLVYGSFETLQQMQEMWQCWTVWQLEQLRLIIGAYENPKKAIFYRVPDEEGFLAVELKGYGIDVSLMKDVPDRTYQKHFRRWLIPNDEAIIIRLKEQYAQRGVEVIDRRPRFQAHIAPREYTESERQQYFLSKLKVEDRPLAEQISNRLIQLRYSWKTVRSYTSQALQWKKWLKDEVAIEQVASETVVAYLTELSKSGISESTLNTAVSALKFYYEKVLGRANFAKIAIERPRKSFTLPRILSKEEVARMLNVTDNLKHRTILFALYSSGLRLSELLNLKIEDIRWERKQIFIRCAKGKKDRVVMLSEVLQKSLQMYCQAYKPVRFLFESTQAGKAYSPKSVQVIVKTYPPTQPHLSQ